MLLTIVITALITALTMLTVFFGIGHSKLKMDIRKLERENEKLKNDIDKQNRLFIAQRVPKDISASDSEPPKRLVNAMHSSDNSMKGDYVHE